MSSLYNNNNNNKNRFSVRIYCEKCGYKVSAGGIDTERHRNKIEKTALAEHACLCDGIFPDSSSSRRKSSIKISRDYHATELGHVYVEQMTRQTRAANTYADVTGAAIADTSFTAGKKYLIFITALLDSSSANNAAFCKVLHGTTDFADSEQGTEPNVVSPSKVIYGWWTVWTAVSGEAIKLQIKNEASNGTTGIDQMCLFAVKLSDDLTENTDWFYNEIAASTTLPAIGTDTTTDNASITFTPGTASQNWLVLAKSRLTGITAANTKGFSHIVRSGEASENLTQNNREGEDATNEYMVLTTIASLSLGASSNTFAEKSQCLGTVQAGTRTHSGVFALNLAKLKNAATAHTLSASSALSTTNYATNIQTVSITPDVQGDVWILAAAHGSFGSAGTYWKARLQVDSTDQPANQTTNAWPFNDSWASDDRYNVFLQTVENLTTSSHTINLDASCEVTTRNAYLRHITALSMELAAAGLALVKVQSTESVLVTEATQAIVVHALTQVQGTEAVQATEATNLSRALARTQATESILATEGTQNLRAVSRVQTTEAVTVSEAREAQLAKLRVLDPESLTVSEATSALVSLARVQSTESLTVDEATNYVKAAILLEVQDESLQAAESTNVLENLVRVQELENITVTEQENPTLALTRIQSTEDLTVSESTQALLNLVREVTLESVQVTESPSSLESLTRVQATESLVLTEQTDKLVTLVQQETLEQIDESVQLSEATQDLLGKNSVYDEQVQLSEATNVTLSLVRVQDESVQASEETELARSLLRLLDTELLYLAEATQELATLVRVQAQEAVSISEQTDNIITPQITALVSSADELVQISEGLQSLLSLTRVQATEAITATEQILAARTVTRVQEQEAVSILEATNIILGKARVQTTESLQLSEAFDRLLAITRVQTLESLQATEQALAARSLARIQATESILATESSQNLRALSRVQTTESVSVSEGTVVALGKLRVQPAESLRITEFTNPASHYVKTLDLEQVLVQEARNIVRGKLQILGTEAIALSEDVTSLKGYAKLQVVNESIAITEASLSAKNLPYIKESEIILRLSGGAGNTSPNASLGGARSNTAVLNNAMDNVYDDVAVAEATSGDTEYRCVYVYNSHPSQTMYSAKIYISQNTPAPLEEVQIAVGTSAVGGTEQSVANENTAPTGVSWSSTSGGEADALDLGDITSGSHKAIWIKRIVSAGEDLYVDNSYRLVVVCFTNHA